MYTEESAKEHILAQNHRIKSLIRGAGFKLFSVSPHDIDYTTSRNVDKNQLERLLELQFIKQAENIIFTGPTGSGYVNYMIM